MRETFTKPDPDLQSWGLHCHVYLSAVVGLFSFWVPIRHCSCGCVELCGGCGVACASAGLELLVTGQTCQCDPPQPLLSDWDRKNRQVQNPTGFGKL